MDWKGPNKATLSNSGDLKGSFKVVEQCHALSSKETLT